MQPFFWAFNISNQSYFAGLTERDLPKKAINIAEPLLKKVKKNRAAVILCQTVIVKCLQDYFGVAPETGNHHLQAHGAQLSADNFACQSLKHNLEERWKHVIDLIVTLQDQNLEQFGRMALGFIIINIRVQNLLI